MDKVHRIQYYKLIRPMKKYKKLKIQLRPNLTHFLVEYGMKQQLSQEYTVQRSIIPHNFKRSTANLLLEPIMYNVISAVLTVQKEVLSKDENRQIKLNNLMEVALKLSGSEIDNLDNFYLNTFNEPLDQVVIKFTNSIGSSCYDKEALKYAILCFQLYIKQTPRTKYSIRDLAKWYTSYTSPNVTEACFSLSNLTEIPGFIVADILLRTPLSSYELGLQTDLWFRYLPMILADFHYSLSKVRTIITNLIYYMTHYETPQLHNFLTETIDCLNSIKTFPYVAKIITKEYRNELLWKIPFDFIQKPSPKITSTSPFYDIIKSQEFLATITSNTQSNTLSLRAQMGIVLSISHISKPKARSFFNKARSKHANLQNLLLNRDMSSFNFLSILLTETPDELLGAFNNATIDHKSSSTLWLGFIKKLLEFELLTPTRSQQILKKLVEQKDNIILTKNMLLHLLLPIGSFQLYSQFFNILNDHKDLTKRLQGPLVEKYLTLLYANPKQEVEIGTLKQLVPGIQQHKENQAIYIARDLYTNFVTKKTSRLIGIMLNGEVQVQPENLYTIYKSQLKQHNLLPDESCLQALIKGALLSPTNNTESCYIWDQLYAPQVAIHEFRSFTVTSDIKTDKIVPTNQLWTIYISMLSKYDYVSELSGIIGWWELINFIPEASTLLTLLRALPIEFSKRHIQHIEKVKSDSKHGIIGNEGPISWPWPTIHDL